MVKRVTVSRTAIHGLVLWVIAVIAIIAGYRLSVEGVLDQDWLSRAGCLIVVLGIWSGLGGFIEQKLQQRALRMKKYMAIRRVRRAFRADKEDMQKEIEKVDKEFAERQDAIRDQLGLSVGVIEASLLMTGTLLWGFGDLIKYF